MDSDNILIRIYFNNSLLLLTIYARSVMLLDHMLWEVAIKEGLFLALLLPTEDDDLSKKHSSIIACLVIGQLIKITKIWNMALFST